MLENGTQVKIKPSSGLPPYYLEGKVVGVMTDPQTFIGAVYAIDVGKPISDAYPYQVVSIPEIHLELTQ